MAKDKTKANKAMEISRGFKEITRLRQMIEIEFRKIEPKVAAEGHPDMPSEDVLSLRLAHSESLRSEISTHESKWHNIAYDRGFFDIEPKAKKMSKFDQ